MPFLPVCASSIFRHFILDYLQSQGLTPYFGQLGAGFAILIDQD